MSDEEVRNGLVVWEKIGHDPDLLDGLLVGELGDLTMAVSELLGKDEAVMRSVPVGLVIRLSQASDLGLDVQLETIRELLRVPTVNAALGRR